MNVKKARFDNNATLALRDEFGGYIFDREFLEQLVYEWIRRMIFYSEFRLSNSIIQSMAIQFKLVLQMDWFFPTKEWLKKFRSTFNLNEVSTRTMDIGYKEGKSVLVRDIVRELVHTREFITKPTPTVANEPIIPDTETPPVEIIEIDNDIKEERDIIEIEDEQFFAGDPTMYDEQPIPHELHVANEQPEASEQLIADEKPVTDDPLIPEELLIAKEPTDQTECDFLDIEDELPRSVCTKYGSTIVQKVQQQRSSPILKLDFEDYLPTSVCKAPDKQETESEPTNTQNEPMDFGNDLLVDPDEAEVATQAPSLAQAKLPTTKDTKCYSQDRTLEKIEKPIYSGSDTPVPTVLKSPTAEISNQVAPRRRVKRRSKITFVRKVRVTPVSLNKVEVTDIHHPPKARIAPKISNTLPNPAPIAAANSDISLPSPDVAVDEQKPTPVPSREPTKFSQRRPLKTRDEALRCIKLMEEFAMMKENFRLIGFIERLEKLIRAGKQK